MKIFLHRLLLLLLALYAIDAIHVTNDGPPESKPPPVTFEPDSDRFIVRYKNEQGKASAKAAAQKVHVDLERQNALAVTLSSEAVEGLQNNPNIEYVEQDSPRYTMMMRGYHLKDDVLKENISNNNETHDHNHRKVAETVPYGIPMVQADQVSYDSSNPRTVCIIDSGYDLGHEDLPSTPNVNGYDGGNLVWNEDGRGHGTHVAGR
jgi:serine protease